MTSLELNQMLYANLLLERFIGFIVLFLIICAVVWQVYEYLQTRPHSKNNNKRFFYAGTFEDFIKDNKKN